VVFEQSPDGYILSPLTERHDRQECAADHARLGQSLPLCARGVA
jgi:hypothetical protein